MKRSLKILTLSAAVLTMVGCTKEVPIGYIGMVQTRGGLTGEVLAPGRHPCWGPGVKMILIEASENVTAERMSILCADDLNFKFDLKIRGQIKSTSGPEVKGLLENNGSSAQEVDVGIRAIPYSALYATYIKPQSRSIARGVVSKYKTTEIRSNREAIDKTIRDKISTSLEGTPMTINMVASSNYDYPDVITKAMETKREREIEIEQEKARQAVKLLQADNRMKLAQKMVVVRAAEGRAEAAYLKQIAPALTKNYVELRRIEAQKPMYEKVGAGDKVIIGSGDAVPFVSR